MENIDIKKINEIDKELDYILNLEDGEQVEPKKKRKGRKPSSEKKNKYYFSEKEETAVIDYISNYKAISSITIDVLEKTFGKSFEEIKILFGNRTLYDIIEVSKNVTIEDKNILYQISVLNSEIDTLSESNEKIYNEVLKPALKKMIESIMRVFHGYIPNEETGTTYNDTLSFLFTKLAKYEPERNTKAYSYYGNICKNYLKGKLLAYDKELMRNPSYDDEGYEFNLTNNIEYSNKMDKGAKIAHEIVEKLKIRLGVMIDDPVKYDLKHSEVLLGRALINLLDNWDFVMSTDGSNKLNKSAVLFFLREQTGLDTKGVRDSMKKFRNEFLLIKNFVIT